MLLLLTSSRYRTAAASSTPPAPPPTTTTRTTGRPWPWPWPWCWSPSCRPALGCGDVLAAASLQAASPVWRGLKGVSGAAAGGQHFLRVLASVCVCVGVGACQCFTRTRARARAPPTHLYLCSSPSNLRTNLRELRVVTGCRAAPHKCEVSTGHGDRALGAQGGPCLVDRCGGAGGAPPSRHPQTAAHARKCTTAAKTLRCAPPPATPPIPVDGLDGRGVFLRSRHTTHPRRDAGVDGQHGPADRAAPPARRPRRLRLRLRPKLIGCGAASGPTVGAGLCWLPGRLRRRLGGRRRQQHPAALVVGGEWV